LLKITIIPDKIKNIFCFFEYQSKYRVEMRIFLGVPMSEAKASASIGKDFYSARFASVLRLFTNGSKKMCVKKYLKLAQDIG
jgi:hypothetical protein